MKRECIRGHVINGLRTNRRFRKRTQEYVRVTTRYCLACNKRKKGSGRGKGYKRLSLTCAKGHPYEGANFRVRERLLKGVLREDRECVTCVRARWARARAKQKERAEAASQEARV